MFGLLKARRRRRLRTLPVPAEWPRILERNFTLYRRLPVEDCEELHGHAHVLLSEKEFEGCGGLTVSDEMRVTIAAQASLLLLHRDTDYFPHLSSILVYPSAYIADVTEYGPGGVVVESWEDRSGETWAHGSLIVSWEDTVAGGSTLDGYNVVLHEFAHQLDLENGDIDGTPRLKDREQYETWRAACTAAFDALCRDVDGGRRGVLDPYASNGPGEFFAVATETFFERPRVLSDGFPEVYAVFRSYFRQDPLTWR